MRLHHCRHKRIIHSLMAFISMLREERLLQLHHICKLSCHLRHPIISPLSKPIYDTAIEQSRRRSRPIKELRRCRVHGKHNVEVSLHICSEHSIQLLICESSSSSVVVASSFLHLVKQAHIILSIEETRHLTAS